MEVDSDHDQDSTFGGDRESLASSSTSLASAIRKYRFENGRRYHSYDGEKYAFPNDEKELERMDIEHHTSKLHFNDRNHLCPLDHPQEILDLGTGSGIWAMEMADEYPECQIIGTDLSPVQPTWVPLNCRFEIEDFTQDWTFGHGRFDMIHSRYVLGCIVDYAAVYGNAYNATKPGGWFELSEVETAIYCDDGSLPEDAPCRKWGKLLDDAFEKINRPLLKADDHEPFLRGAGFVNVQKMYFKRPTNDWPKDPRMKEIGRFGCLNMLEGLEGFTMAPLTRILGWQKEEVDVFIAQVKSDLVNRRLHGWQKGIVLWGQKPLSEEQMT